MRQRRTKGKKNEAKKIRKANRTNTLKDISSAWRPHSTAVSGEVRQIWKPLAGSRNRVTNHKTN
jgi:hypothetical protein